MAVPDFTRLLEEGRRALIEEDLSAFGDVLSRLSGYAGEVADASAEAVRAQLLYMANRYDEALDATRRALSSDGRQVIAHEIEAQIYFFRNQLEEARQAALRALETNPLGELARSILDHIERRRARLFGDSDKTG